MYDGVEMQRPGATNNYVGCTTGVRRQVGWEAKDVGVGAGGEDPDRQGG